MNSNFCNSCGLSNKFKNKKMCCKLNSLNLLQIVYPKSAKIITMNKNFEFCGAKTPEYNPSFEAKTPEYNPSSP